MVAVIYIILLPLAVCIDTFAAGVSLGVGKLKVSGGAVWIIAGLSGIGMAVSLYLSAIVGRIIPPERASLIIGIALITIGVATVAVSLLKSRLVRGELIGHLKLDGIWMSVKISLNPGLADRDCDSSICPKEALALAVPLALDTVASGLSAGVVMTVYEKTATALLTLLLGAVSVALGGMVGKRLSRHIEIDSGILSGAILLILGVFVLVGA